MGDILDSILEGIVEKPADPAPASPPPAPEPPAPGARRGITYHPSFEKEFPRKA